MKKNLTTSIILITALLLGSTTQKDFFQSHIDKLKALFNQQKKNFKMFNQEENTNLKAGKSKVFPCTNGENPKNLSPKTYLKKFVEGPCNPTVFVPGVAGSKLIAEIDCEVLREKNPDIFKACGWEKCKYEREKKGDFPKKEYKVWIPGLGSRMSLTVENKKSRTCFSGLMGMKIVKDEKGVITAKDTEGVKIHVLGASKETNTLKTSNCGFDAITDILPLKIIQTHESGYFDNLKTAFEDAGYKIGLTLQALPWDWRLGYQMNDLHWKFSKVVNKLSEITGKRVVIVSHSMGNYQTMHYLWRTSQTEKDNKIARYIAVAPPYLGASRAAMHQLGMDDKLNINLRLIDLGITADVFEKTIAKYPSDFQLIIKPFFKMNRNKPWMNAIRKRIQEERLRTEPQTRGNIMDIFPSLKEKCAKYFKNRNSDCYTGLSDMWNFGLMVEEELNPDRLEDLFSVYSMNSDALQMYQWAQDKRFDEMLNPGVQTNIMYSNMHKTLSKFFYEKDPRSLTLQKRFYMPDGYDYQLGDETVETASAITPAIKWAWEFENELFGSKPVNFIELCSSYNPRKSVFEENGDDNEDDNDDEVEKQVKKNAYFGSRCNCIGNDLYPNSGEDCNHMAMVSDPKLVEFILNSSMDGKKGKLSDEFLEMSNEKIEEFKNECKLFILKRPSDFIKGRSHK